MASDQSATATFFNDPTLSDVKLLQIHNGETKEYYAHKQILGSQSKYFRNAFTGNFKEATDATMKLHDDDPAHFEIVLKFVYTLTLDIGSLPTLPEERVKQLLGICTVADKYDVTRILSPVAEELERNLAEFQEAEFDFYTSIVESYYDSCLFPDTRPGRIIAHHTVRYGKSNVGYDDFKTLIKNYPTFGTDVALNQYKEITAGLTLRKCSRCHPRVTYHDGPERVDGGKKCLGCGDYPNYLSKD